MNTEYKLAVMDHRKKVITNLMEVTGRLKARGLEHDISKFEEPEASAFEKIHEAAASMEFGSPEYVALMREHRPAIEHHQQHNRHHPEYHTGGVLGMTLIDLIEMFCDWKAASERNVNGNFLESLLKCCARFKIGIELQTILLNTMKDLGWDNGEKTKVDHKDIATECSEGQATPEKTIG